MKTVLRNIPWLLIYSRIVIGLAIGILAFSPSPDASKWIVILMAIGLLSDIFDGIIARRLNVSTKKLRLWDSNVDQIFWLVTIAAVFYLNQAFVQAQLFWIVTLVVFEMLCYVISYLKFKKPVATHTLLAKMWTITLLWFLIDLALNSTSTYAFSTCVILGIISRIEIILIFLTLKKWATDVPSILAVSKINRGLPVRRFKLFN